MSDKAREAAEAYELSNEAITYDELEDGERLYEAEEIRKAYKAGWAASRDAMRCETCRYCESFTCQDGTGYYRCENDKSCAYSVNFDFGCRLHEAKD